MYSYNIMAVTYCWSLYI